MNDPFVRLVITILWIIAFIVQFMAIWQYPKAQQRERFWLSWIMLSYVAHVIIFYVCVQLSRAGAVDYITSGAMDWSRVLRIHGAIALISKEIVTIVKLKNYESVSRH